MAKNWKPGKLNGVQNNDNICHVTSVIIPFLIYSSSHAWVGMVKFATYFSVLPS
jgi:hypothetical protein